MAKVRSPNYPSVPLEDAIEAVDRLWKKERGTVVTQETAAKGIGFSGLSGPARSKLAALKQYGLLEGRGKLTVSDLAKRVLMPRNPQEKKAAIREAALTPELFRNVHDAVGQGSDDSISSYLGRELGFSERGTRAFITSYRKTASYARLSEEGNDLAEGPGEGANMDTFTPPTMG